MAAPGILSVGAQAEPTLPPRDADQIIAEVLSADPVPFSGEVSQTNDLGLPSLPSEAGVDFTNPDALWSLASGTNTWRLWYDGDHSYRVALIRGQSESDLISNGSVVWAWSSQSQTAIRTELDPTDRPDQRPIPVESPQEAAREVLRELEQYSTVTTDENIRVAGRSAYELVVTPADPQTRVAEVRMAVDAETALPLRLEVVSTVTGEPAVEIAFNRIDYARPNASVFEFTPPPGAEVIERAAPQRPQLPEDAATGEATPGDEVVPADPDAPVTTGEGWSQVTVVPPHAPASDAETPAAAAGNPLAGLLPRVSGEWGSGSVLDGTLVSVVFADDGRIAFGAVEPEALYEALTR